MHAIVQQALLPAWQHLFAFIFCKPQPVSDYLGGNWNTRFTFGSHRQHRKHKRLVVRNSHVFGVPNQSVAAMRKFKEFRSSEFEWQVRKPPNRYHRAAKRTTVSHPQRSVHCAKPVRAKTRRRQGPSQPLRAFASLRAQTFSAPPRLRAIPKRNNKPLSYTPPDP